MASPKPQEGTVQVRIYDRTTVITITGTTVKTALTGVTW
jgi:hypothetical protein